MPVEDRHRLFEKALARRLRGDAQQGSCPDSQALAAYHERSLTPEELIKWKYHVAECARCQEILMALESTALESTERPGARTVDEDDIPVFEVPILAVKAVPELAPARLQAEPERPVAVPALRLEDVGEVIASDPGANVVKLAAREKRRPAYWRWVAPAGAIAAVLVIWVAVREPKPAMVDRKTPVAELQAKIAEQNRRKTATKSSASAESKESNKDALTTQALKLPASQVPSSKGESSAYGYETRASAAQPEERANDGLSTAHDAKKFSNKLGKLDKAAGAAASVAPGGPVPLWAAKTPGLPPQRKLAAPSAAPAATPGRADSSPGEAQTGRGVVELKKMNAAEEKREQKAESRPRPAAESEKVQQAAQAVAPSAPAPAAAAELADAKNRAEPSGDALAHKTAQPMFRERDLDESLRASVPGSRTVTAPGGRVSWILGGHGVILYSSDRGSTWKGQKSGTSSSLAAGVAPSETVCWLVGGQGTILLTTDAGQHWQRIPAPTTADLVRVAARDAQNAAVWADPQLPPYVTRDGGRNWQQAGDK